MKTKNIPLVSIIVFATSICGIHAIPVAFNLRDTAATAEIESGAITRGGIQATLTATVAGGSGSLNQTTTGFGIDASGADVSNELDNGGGAETISIVFNQDVRLTVLGLSDFTTSESALLTVNGFPAQTLTGLAAASDVYNFSANNLVLSGQTVILKWGSGNGFSFDSFTVDSVTSVPDSSPGFGGVFAILLLLTAAHRANARCASDSVKPLLRRIR